MDPAADHPPAPARGRPFTFSATVEQIVLAAALFWLLAGNRVFLGAALKGRSVADVSAWGFGAAVALAVLALHVLLLALAANRWTVKPLVAVLTLVMAAAAWFMGQYGVFLDPSMLRNVLHTEAAKPPSCCRPRWLRTCCCMPCCRCCCWRGCVFSTGPGRARSRCAPRCCWPLRRCWWARCWRCSSLSRH